MMFKRYVAMVLIVGTLFAFAAPAGANGLTVLGTDPALDAPPGSDLTSIAVAAHGSDLHIQMTFANSIPVAGTYGPLVGIEWFFTARGKTYLAEAYPDGASFGYVLFEMNGDVAKQIETLEGEFDTVGGVLDMYVPLKAIGARKGTVIAGAGENDGDVHVHAGATTLYPEVMTTTKSYRVR